MKNTAIAIEKVSFTIFGTSCVVALPAANAEPPVHSVDAATTVVAEPHEARGEENSKSGVYRRAER